MKALEIINRMLTEQGINYEFMRYSRKPKFPYFVGSYTEIPNDIENGLQESTFTLDGYHNGSWFALETAKDKIKALFDNFTTVEEGIGVAISYENAMPVPIDSSDMKRIQIYLDIKEWSVI